jgi:hypothetical protein
MPRIKYENHNFRPAALKIIEQANQICREYQRAGYDLTLRQLYYQFVSRDWIPNNQKSYDRLGKIINDARMAGLLDWNYIVDRTRNLRGLRHWDDPAAAVKWLQAQYAIDKWADQPTRIEVWIEKDALVGVLEAACTPEDVPFFSCRGYTSASEVWGAAQRLRRYIEQGQTVTILHLGDHDPSGVDMTRDIRERLWLFIATDLFQDGMDREEAVQLTDDALKIKRIALNMRQVERYNPPPNFAKFTDARYKKYVERYGRQCWELDALPPDVLVNLIRGHIDKLRDQEAWAIAVTKEQKHSELLQLCSDRWNEVATFLEKKAS